MDHMSQEPTCEELAAKIRQLENRIRAMEAAAPAENSERDIIREFTVSFQQLADHSQDAIYLYDVESGTFPFFNKRFLSLYEVEEDGRKILSTSGAARHIHPADVEKLRLARERTLASGGTQGEVEYRYIAPDGTTRWMHDRWTVVRDSRHRAVAIEGFIRDNTQRKQAEAELEHSRNSALIGSYIVQDRRFRYVNPEFCRITGYSKAELIGRPSMNLVQAAYREQVQKNAALMLRGQRSTPYSFRIVDKKGRLKWVMETVTAVKHEGRRAALGYFMDTTQQKQIEKEHREKEKLKAILEMAGAVSHELNSPLQVVLTGIEKLGAGDRSPEQQAFLMELVKKSTQRIIELSAKIQRISQYASKDYVDGKKIIDIDAAAGEPSDL